MERRGATLWVGAAALAVLTVTVAPAEAFYWYGPPQKTIVVPPGPENPPPPPGEPPPPPVEPPPPPPISTPEPATVFGALIGLGALAARRAVRGRQG